MCNCSSFTGNRPSEITTDEFTGNRPSEITTDEFTGNRPSQITADFDGESELYDNFFTQKQRERRKQIKAGIQSGLSRKDAKTQALASLPRTKLNELIGKIKNGQDINVVQTPLGDVKLDPKIDEKLNELADAMKKESIDGNPLPIEQEPTFFEKNKMYIIGGIVLIGGIFAYYKFIKK